MFIRLTLTCTNLEKIVNVPFRKPVKRKKRISIQLPMVSRITSEPKNIH